MLVASGFAARLRALFAAVWIAGTLAVDQAAAQNIDPAGSGGAHIKRVCNAQSGPTPAHRNHKAGIAGLA